MHANEESCSRASGTHATVWTVCCAESSGWLAPWRQAWPFLKINIHTSALSPHPSSPNVTAVNEQTPASPLTRRPAQLCGLLSVPSALLKVSGRAAQTPTKAAPHKEVRNNVRELQRCTLSSCAKVILVVFLHRPAILARVYLSCTWLGPAQVS